MIGNIFQDYHNNRGHVKIVFILAFFRLVNLFACRKGSIMWWIGVPLMVLYRVIVEYILCVELRASTRVGPGLKIEHGYSLVINDRTVIGRNVHFRHCVTVGCVKRPDGSQGPCPVFGDNVEIGANSVIIGDIKIGDNSKIGAGSVVTKDVPPNAVVAGNPARILKYLGKEAGKKPKEEAKEEASILE
jgi:putative colanic acid biosynthesis acetyltransferase WcaB